MNLTNSHTIPSVLDLPRQALKPRASGLALWRPDIVLAQHGAPDATPPGVVIAEPALRPEAVRAQIDATRSVLASVVELRRTLGAQAADAEARAQSGGSERERVAAVVEAYRIQGALDEVLQRTLRRARALLQEQGLR